MGKAPISKDRQRDVHFPHRLFGEPARDLLLALFIARDNGREMSVSEAYKATAVSPAAGKRLLDMLERDGLIARRAAPSGGKRQLVALTGEPGKQLSDYLAQLK